MLVIKCLKYSYVRFTHVEEAGGVVNLIITVRDGDDVGGLLSTAFTTIIVAEGIVKSLEEIIDKLLEAVGIGANLVVDSALGVDDGNGHLVVKISLSTVLSEGLAIDGSVLGLGVGGYVAGVLGVELVQVRLDEHLTGLLKDTKIVGSILGSSLGEVVHGAQAVRGDLVGASRRSGGLLLGQWPEGALVVRAGALLLGGKAGTGGDEVNVVGNIDGKLVLFGSNEGTIALLVSVLVVLGAEERLKLAGGGLEGDPALALGHADGVLGDAGSDQPRLDSLDGLGSRGKGRSDLFLSVVLAIVLRVGVRAAEYLSIHVLMWFCSEGKSLTPSSRGPWRCPSCAA